MDSGNSGSLQSSSGGDEEYDSRTESISSFLNPSFHRFAPISNLPQPRPISLHQNQPPPTFFDPHALNLKPFSHSSSQSNPNSPNTLYNNLDLVWSKSATHQRSDPNYSDQIGNPTALLSSSSTQSLLGPHRPTHGAGLFSGPSSAYPPMPLPAVDENGRLDQNQNQTNTVKTSRKRTRASRRAPTTILTTDTTNFRQMVQEFTGIPAPPFSTAASPYSRRLDLFGSALRSSGHLETLSPLFHPFRPSAQKVQPSAAPFLNPTMNVDSSNSTISTSIAGPCSTFQIPSDLGFLSKTPQTNTILNIQNPQNFPFQALLQPSLKYPQATNASLDELGLANNHMNASLAGFSGPSGGGPTAEDQEQLECGYNKMNGSDFHLEKQLENVPQRNGGTVDPWICPSD